MGISITMGANYSLDMRYDDYELGEVPDLESVSGTSTTITGYFSDGTKLKIGGSFSYDKYGYLVDGTVRNISQTYGGQNVVTITGASLSIKSILQVADTSSTTDDIALVKSLFQGNDSIYGSSYADVILGLAGNDVLSGKAGSDKLYGGDGNDLLYGGAGHDYLTGGAGADTFTFRSASDSTYLSTGRDSIFDFNAQDKIDLSGIDANQKLTGNQAFTYIGKSGFHGVSGELRFEKQASDTYIYADVNGDKKADFSIHLDDAVDILKAYFIV